MCYVIRTLLARACSHNMMIDETKLIYVGRKCHVAWSATNEREKRTAKFNGPECTTSLDHWDELTDIAIPIEFNREKNKLA